MSTLGGLIDSTMMYLSGFSTVQDQSTHLTGSGVTDTGLTFTVSDPEAVSRGLAEIGSEMVWVDSVDPVTSIVTIAPYGRGYRGTTKVAHVSGEQIISNPTFPRALVKDAINQTILGTYPSLYGVGTSTFTFDPMEVTAALPADAETVLSVSWEGTLPTQEWLPVRRWRRDDDGGGISIYDALPFNRTVKVVYTKVPTPLSALTDQFSSTGLQPSAEDLIIVGAAAKLVAFFDVPHLAGASAEADFSVNQRPQNGAVALSRYLMQMYGTRLTDEVRRLQDLYPIRSHYTR